MSMSNRASLKKVFNKEETLGHLFKSPLDKTRRNLSHARNSRERPTDFGEATNHLQEENLRFKGPTRGSPEPPVLHFQTEISPQRKNRQKVGRNILRNHATQPILPKMM